MAAFTTGDSMIDVSITSCIAISQLMSVLNSAMPSACYFTH